MIPKIVFVGHPVAGKTTLLEALAQLWGLPRRESEIASPNQDRITSSYGKIQSAPLEVCLMTTKGAIFDKQIVREKVLRNATVVGFIFTPPQEGFGFPLEEQLEELEQTLAEAEALGVGPDRVPCLAIVTKVGLVRTTAFQVPPRGFLGPFEVDSPTGLGVPEVAAAILKSLPTGRPAI